ncbi:16554_t:CDS:1, partial [Entrophospora sp. SA101]
EEAFADITGGDGKKGNVVLREFVRSFVRKTADAMGLDIKNNNEYKIAEKWSTAGYKEETIKSLKDGTDEEFLKSKGKDAKSVWDEDPKKLHKEIRDYQISKEGVTSENYKEFKEKDKEKLEKVLSYLEDLVEHKLADEKQIEFKKQLSSHIATLTTTTPPSGDGKGEEGKGDGKGEEGKGDGKGEEGK